MDLMINIADNLSFLPVCQFQELAVQRLLTIPSGPMLTTGDELATAASSVLGTEMKFEDISSYVFVHIQSQQTEIIITHTLSLTDVKPRES